MAVEILVRPAAKQNIEQSALWYERQQPGLSLRFLHELDQLLNRIIDAPLQFPTIHNNVRRGLLRHFPYGVYFLNEPNRVVLLAVLHLRRHPDTWRQRT